VTPRAPRPSSRNGTAAPTRATAVIHVTSSADGCCRSGPSCGTTPATAHFQPLFLYESISGLLGMLTLLWLSRRFADRLRTGEIALIFFIWYAAVRFCLEFLRVDNWTFFGIPMAQLISTIVIVVSVVLLVSRHRRLPPGLSRPSDREPADDPDGPSPIEAGAAAT